MSRSSDAGLFVSRDAPHAARFGFAAVMLAVGLAGAGPLAGQDALNRELASARTAWLARDMAALVARSDTVRLQLPGIAVSASLRPGQAARLLERYLGASEEVSFALRELRQLAPDHAYAEVVRSYVVQGTSEERSETVFLGFRRLGDVWRLREVRVTP